MANSDRLVRVSAVSQDGVDLRAPKEQIVEATLERMERAATSRPDLVCLPEGFAGQEPESVPGPLLDRLGAWARGKSCYLIAALHTGVAGRVYNSAVLFDRAGKIVGQYNKIHLTEGELEKGICPDRDDPPVFETDFGAIGMQICFDVNWRETWRRLKEKGARIVFWPSAFPACRRLSALAWMNEFYVVSATRRHPSCIFDLTGEELARSGQFRPCAEAELPLGKRLFEIDYHVKVAREIEKKYGPRVRIEWFHNEDWFTLVSRDPNLPTEEVIREFGLTPLYPYLSRCEGAIDRARAKYDGAPAKS